jgi:hypothetical protein
MVRVTKHIRTQIILSLLTVLLIGLFCLFGCTASQLASADRTVGGTPLPPTTAYSTTQPGVIVTLLPTTQQITLHLVQDASNAAAPVVTAAAPAPWGWIASGVLGIVAAVAGVFAQNQSSKAATANAVIAAAAPGIAHLVGQATDNQTLATDITSIAQVAPGVISLLAHSSAAAAAPVVAINPTVAAAVSAAK